MTPTTIDTIHGDCMEGMATMRDNQFDLAIVDPPYMENIEEYMGMQKRMTGAVAKRVFSNIKHFKKPDRKYFDALMRVSKNQIIWGVNHYDIYFGRGRIVWDKKATGQYNRCEIAYHSIGKGSVDLFEYTWNGMIQGNMKDKEIRIHPTQKPVALYRWLLKNYAKEGDTILDTHGGSMSLAIACWDMKHDATIYEIDEEYYDAAVKRFKRYISQGQLF